jgi:predicted RNA polymerase sigma factor
VAGADFEGFYRAHYARLVGQMVAVVGDVHEAEDVVQEAFAPGVAALVAGPWLPRARRLGAAGGPQLRPQRAAAGPVPAADR